MRTLLTLTPLLAVLSACTAASPAATPPAGQQTSRANPAVIELYQSQGCSSCPPALAVLDRVASRPDVLALNFAVTYWDQLGWKDKFASPQFTERQWDYARAGGRPEVATPQLIVNGRAAVLGSRQPEVEQAIVRYARPANEPAITQANGQVDIGRGARTNAQVWVVDYDPRRIAVPINAGENNGRTLIHRNIVRRLAAIGAYTGDAVRLAPGPRISGLQRAVLVQAGKGGAIVAAARL